MRARPGGGRRDGLIHAVYGGIYGKDHDVIYEHKWTSPDLMPVLIGSEASLAELNARLQAQGDGTIGATRFRPNVLVQGHEPWSHRGPGTRRAGRRFSAAPFSLTGSGERVVIKEVILTPEGLEELKAKIEHLSGPRRREVAERIKEAREFGDISENSEYDDAKNEQAMLEKQIAELEEKLRSATVIDAKSVSTEAVSVGTTVHVKDQKTDKSVKYMIVGSSEANPSDNKLSNESPVGKALIGRKRGDVVSVPVPRGPARKLKITKIEA